ncbi:hypothetical protein, partial [Intestinimonas butyriciproducens]|uniref:hypothetical protein n=1 Tax=Intestinimonas butyriciproducens TaxID=1297617 RepID=UPI0034A440A8
MQVFRREEKRAGPAPPGASNQRCAKTNKNGTPVEIIVISTGVPFGGDKRDRTADLLNAIQTSRRYAAPAWGNIGKPLKSQAFSGLDFFKLLDFSVSCALDLSTSIVPFGGLRRKPFLFLPGPSEAQVFHPPIKGIGLQADFLHGGGGGNLPGPPSGANRFELGFVQVKRLAAFV